MQMLTEIEPIEYFLDTWCCYAHIPSLVVGHDVKPKALGAEVLPVIISCTCDLHAVRYIEPD